MPDKTFVKNTKSLFFVVVVIFIFVSIASAQNMFRKMSDFDGDGKTDFVIVRHEGNQKVWYVALSGGGYKTFAWGLASDQTVLGDYDGDGKTDFAVYRPYVYIPDFGHAYTYYIFQSQTNSFTYKVFRKLTPLGDGPVYQDYDNDGKTDPGLWHYETGLGSFLYILNSTTNTISTSFIPANNAPLRLGDTDGNGASDTAYVQSNHVTIIDSSGLRSFHFGVSGDTYLFGDFDGDGKGDLSVWRDSAGDWYWLGSADSVIYRKHWGVPGDRPVPGDYDGDGKTDQAVWRPESPNGTYYINGSATGFRVFKWGIPSDFPVRY